MFGSVLGVPPTKEVRVFNGLCKMPSKHTVTSAYTVHTMQMKRRSPIKFVDSRGDLVLCITLEVEAHVSRTVPGPA